LIKPLPEGVTLVQIAAEHAEAVVDWRMRPANRSKFLGHATITLESQLACTRQARDDPKGLTCIALHHGTPVGMVALYNIMDGAAEYGRVLIDNDRRRHHIGLAISGRIVAFGFARLGLEQIYANCLVTNRPIHGLLERLGFDRDGTRRHAPSGRDVLRLRITRTAWQSSAARPVFENGLDDVLDPSRAGIAHAEHEQGS